MGALVERLPEVVAGRYDTVLGESLGAVRLAGAREENLSIRLRDGAGAGDVKERLASACRREPLQQVVLA